MDEEILPIWQPVGHSTHIIAKNVAEKYSVLTSHTGVIDPMAEGVIIILLGEERLKKYDYASWPKEYEFEMVFELKTDTYDGLGMVSSCKGNTLISEDALEKTLASLKGDYIQDYPPYSSKVVKGKPLHWYSRNKKLHKIEIPKKHGEIYEIEFLDLQEKPLESIVEDVTERISIVTGDFRQKEIIKIWETYLADNSNLKLQVAKIRVKMSKGLYVRGLAVDIASKLDTCSFVYTLVRTKNGDYLKDNSKTLEDVFGLDFMDKYNFVSRGKV